MKKSQLAIALLLLPPSIGLAEVSDKMPTISSIYITAISVGVVAFLLAWFRWWLVFLGLLAGIAFAIGTTSLWQETAMKEALITEQGMKYFIALAFQSIFAFTGALLGFALARRKSNAA